MTPLRKKVMENEPHHPALPLTIINDRIVGPNGTVGYVDCGEQYIYICFYEGKLVVAEHNSLNSIITRYARKIIRKKYYYAFKILCHGGVTAVAKVTPDDIELVGVMSGYLASGERLWHDAIDVEWPGARV